MLHLLLTCYVLKPMNQTATTRQIRIIIADAAHDKPTFREYFAGAVTAAWATKHERNIC